MSPLLAPILAQLVTLGVGDSSELRYVRIDYSRVEAATSPRVGLNFGWQRTNLSLAYGPTLTVTPLDSSDRRLLAFHAGSLAASYRWRRTALYFSESVGYGQVNFAVQAFADPNTTPVTGAPNNPVPTMGGTTPPVPNPTPGGLPNGTPGTGTQTQPGTVNQLRAIGRVVDYGTSYTTAGFSQVVSPALLFGGSVFYLYAGAFGAGADVYPSVKGPGASATGTYRFTSHDGLATSLTTQYAQGSVGNNSVYLIANEAWSHVLDPRTTTLVGAGVSTFRNSLRDGTVSYSVFPTLNASINHVTPLKRSAVSFGANAVVSPVIDPVLATVNPRLSFAGFLGWSTKRFSTSATLGTAVSLGSYGKQAGTFNSINGSLGANYQLADAVSLNTGVRANWQSFQGFSNVPLGYAVFAGLSFAAVVPLSR
jgi:hypothetical protein